MAPSTETVVAQFHITTGLWQESAPSMRVVEPRSLLAVGARRDRMYILLETVGAFADPNRVCRRIADTVEDTYFRNRGSITAKLWAALKAANRELFEQNLEAPTNERGVVGINCVLLHGADAFIIQAGPALTYLLHGETMERFPSRSAWLSRHIPALWDARQATALGWRRDIEPDLYYFQVEAGDLIVLASSALVRLASDERIVQALSPRDSAGVRQNLEALGRDRDLSAIVVQLVAATERQKRAPAPAPVEAPQQEPTPARIIPAKTTRDERLELVMAEPLVADQEEPQPHQVRATDWEPDFEPEWENTEQEEAEQDMAAEPIPLPWEEAEEEGIRREPKTFDSQAGTALAGVGRFLRMVGKGMLPEHESRPGRPKRAAPRQERAPARLPGRTTAWLAIIAILIPVLIGVFFLARGILDRRATEAYVREHLTQARDALQAAASGEPAQQRAKLGQVFALSQEVLAREPGNVLAQALQITATQQLDVVNHVVRVDYPINLKDFSKDVTDAISPQHLLVNGSELYVLDSVAELVQEYSFDSTGQAFKSQTPQYIYPSVTMSSDLLGKQLVDIAAVTGDPDQDAPRLLILTADGLVLETTQASRDLQAKRVQNSEAWREPVTLGTYGVSPGLFLYLLDPKANIIHKYQTFGGDYGDDPLDYPLPNENVTLFQAVDMAIDGNVYILLGTGEIVKLAQGKRVDFSLEGLDIPLKDPVAIAVSPQDDVEAGHVYVADAGNGRIVQFDKFGYFMQQFKPGEGAGTWDQLTDLWPDELAGRVYYLNGGLLSYLNLP